MKLRSMAKKLMHALQYSGYGGGPSGLKVNSIRIFFSFLLQFSIAVFQVVYIIYWSFSGFSDV